MKNKKTKISVVIPTFGNSWKTLRKCIDSILSQTFLPTEILIIDNSSSDDTFNKISSLKSQISDIKLFRNNINLGVTGGRNRGIQKAAISSDYIFFFDHDMYAEKHMLVELLQVAESDENIGIVTPKIFYWRDKKRIWAAGTGINLWTGQVLFRGGRDEGKYEKVEEVQVAPAAMLVKKKVIQKIGDFDNNYFATYEDTDYSFRARRAGFKVYYAPRAVAYHDLPIDLKEESIRLLSRSYLVGRNRILFMKKFGKNFLIFTLFLPVYVFYYLLLSLKNKRFNAWREFLRGTAIGLFS
jgi:hypothetical protein